MHWACSHHALGRATQQIQDGDDGQPAGAASASSVEGVRRGRSDIWPYPMARSASPAASAHVGKPLDPSSSTSTGARATFRHRARAEEALQYSSLIATEELTELLKPASTVPLYQYIPL